MEYDLFRIFGHPLMLDDLLPHALVLFGGLEVTEYRIEVHWRKAASTTMQRDTLMIRWDLDQLEQQLPNLRRKVRNLLERDEYQPLQTEYAVILVAVAVLAHVEPGPVIIKRADRGSFHDYYLNESEDEMVEIAGRSTTKEGLDHLFLEEKAQSDRNAELRKRWVSVTVFANRPRNRTEGLHP